MWTDSFNKTTKHQLINSELTVGLSLKVYKLSFKISSPVKKMNLLQEMLNSIIISFI